MSVRALDIPKRAEQAQVAAAPAGGELHVLYGSQTGNGEAVAETLADQARQSGLRVVVKSLADLRPTALKKIQSAAFVMSTHGDGDPPDDALDLFEWLEGNSGQDLASLGFRILALGDQTYAEFCAAGRQLADLLKSRGASEFGPMVECDVDYAAPAETWSGEVLDWARENIGADASNESQDLPSSAPRLSVVATTPSWARARPFPAIVNRIQKITGLESDKDVFHLELSLEDSGLSYEPGDSLGVWVDNDPEQVSHLVKRLGLSPAALIDDKGSVRSLRTLLSRHREITRLSPNTIAAWANLDAERGAGKLARRWARMDSEARKDFMEARQFLDLVEAYPLAVEPQELADLLPALASRTYSIASSQAVVDEEVHLTVVTLRSNAIGTERNGVASTHLNHVVQAGDELRVFMEPNKRFRLPEDSAAPVIMIAAGTGIAPFRAFAQQMEEAEPRRGTWLIFGNPHRRSDFLYQREWLKWREQGIISRIDGAFSRDQAEKRYVQHIVAEQGAELARWIDDGAYIYICGALAMGHAVEEALAEALAEARGLDAEAAQEAVKDLRRGKRLLKDLY